MSTWSTLQRARSLGERHPDAPATVKALALYLASYARGTNGTGIYPGLETTMRETGFSKSVIARGIAWLVEHGELRRDNAGRRGSRASFTYLGVGLPNGEASDPESAQPVPAKHSCPECGKAVTIGRHPDNPETKAWVHPARSEGCGWWYTVGFAPWEEEEEGS